MIQIAIYINMMKILRIRDKFKLQILSNLYIWYNVVNLYSKHMILNYQYYKFFILRLLKKIDKMLYPYKDRPLIIALFHFPLFKFIIWCIIQVSLKHNKKVAVIVEDNFYNADIVNIIKKKFDTNDEILVIYSNRKSSLRLVYKHLENNGFLIYLPDITTTNPTNTVLANFINSKIRIPSNLVSLSQKLDIPILVLQHYLKLFKINLDYTVLDTKDYPSTQHVIQAMVDSLIKLVKANPSQWLSFKLMKLFSLENNIVSKSTSDKNLILNPNSFIKGSR